MSSHLESLPYEILELIFEYLSSEDLLSLGRTSQRFNDTILDNNFLWYKLLLQNYYSKYKNTIYYVRLKTSDCYLELSQSGIENTISQRKVNIYYDDELYRIEFFNIRNFIRNIQQLLEDRPALDDVYKYIMITEFLKYESKIKKNLVPEYNLCFFYNDNIITYLNSPYNIDLAIDSGINVDYYWSETSPLVTAIQENFEEKVQVLLEVGANPNQFYVEDNDSRRTCTEWTPLILALNNENVEIVRLLLKFGADPNLKEKSRGKQSPSTFARGNIGLTRLLIEHGANIPFLEIR